MIRIEKLKRKDITIFHKLLLKIFDEGFNDYPKNAQKYNKNHWSKKRLTEYSKNRDILMLTAWDKNTPVGYLIGKYIKPDKSLILWLGVVNSLQGQGIGTKLVVNCERWSKLKGAGILKASTANFKNDRFYKSLGFEQSPSIVKNDWGMKKIVFFKKLL